MRMQCGGAGPRNKRVLGANPMDIKEVKDLINEILQSDISEFELEHTGTRLKLRRGMRDAENVCSAPQDTVIRQMQANPKTLIAAENPITPQTGPVATDDGLHFITSPIVGTFYRAPAPGAEPYVKTGARVEEGSILCIVEAMKLMNEIPSDIAGEIATICVENGQPVEYGQKLFGIKPHR